MRCPNCQMEVDPGRGACGYCGAPVYPAQPYAPAPAYAPAPGYAPAPYAQPAPGYYPPPGYVAPQPMGYYAAPPRQPSATPVAGGALVLIGGILSLMVGIYDLAAGAAMSAIPVFGEAMMICASVQILFAILGVIGGICAIQRKAWGMALVGSIFCMLSIGFFGISFILGLIGLILIAISKEDFV